MRCEGNHRSLCLSRGELWGIMVRPSLRELVPDTLTREHMDTVSQCKEVPSNCIVLYFCTC